MELDLGKQLFIVGGASSGFGKSISEALIKEGSQVIAVARGEENLNALKRKFPQQLETLAADITQEETKEKLLEMLNNRQLHGIVLNAGGPPAMTVLESSASDWDKAYHSVLRWKVTLLNSLMPIMQRHQYGRVLFIESASVKQPIENLVLSNAFRLAVIGYMKTFSQEMASQGITLNALAPGYHYTNALHRIVSKKIEQRGITNEEATAEFVTDSQVGFLGAAEDFASLAAWLLSPQSKYITGQTITVAGGAIKGVMG